MGLIQNISDQGDIELGLVDRIEYDPIDDTMIRSRTQECAPILERNKILLNEGDGYTPSRDMRRVASIPVVLIEKWMKEEGINAFDKNDWDKVAAKLDDPELRFLRTAPGKVSRRPVRHAISSSGVRHARKLQ